jgi:hypothetical protein
MPGMLAGFKGIVPLEDNTDNKQAVKLYHKLRAEKKRSSQQAGK